MNFSFLSYMVADLCIFYIGHFNNYVIFLLLSPKSKLKERTFMNYVTNNKIYNFSNKLILHINEIDFKLDSFA